MLNKFIKSKHFLKTWIIHVSRKLNRILYMYYIGLWLVWPRVSFDIAVMRCTEAVTRCRLSPTPRHSILFLSDLVDSFYLNLFFFVFSSGIFVRVAAQNVFTRSSSRLWFYFREKRWRSCERNRITSRI